MSPRKKPRAPRVRLTHLEIRRGATLRLRIAVADDTLTEVGDELSALIKRAAPRAQPAATAVRSADVAVPTILVDAGAHDEHDATHHAELRNNLVGLFSSLCDTSLEDALEAARQERARRAEGAN